MSGLAFTKHACRHCMGAILQDERGFICSICRRHVGGSVTGLCGCGITVEAPSGAEKRVGFRCVANPAPSSLNPAAIVIVFDGQGPPPAREGR